MAVLEHTAEDALAAHGFDGARLQRLAHRVANDWLRGKAATLQSKREDLISFLCLRALEAALHYDPHRINGHGYGSNGGDPFQSYLADVMENRIVDFYRRKSEGFGDRRYGFDGMVDLSDDPDPADHDMDFESVLTARRRAKWQTAALSTNLDLRDWILITLDHAADATLARAG